ncbi:MAG: hypothetical protein COV44_11910 [Deltaproteobacteria bacterium CG11_big_fil_rev_8_21_14_0_20_45_16]|nr:MAG: hypothetical protein COV44_11910 [Deltaproteobacteria bacterium CG11_big_fil_rev_8_21_14_0_20_45_16]
MRKESKNSKRPPREEVEGFLKDVESGKIEGSYALPSDASQLDRVKYSLCRDFVAHLRKAKISQRDLAKTLETDEARISEVVHYKIWLFSADQLIAWHEKLFPETTSIRFA